MSDGNQPGYTHFTYQQQWGSGVAPTGLHSPLGEQQGWGSNTGNSANVHDHSYPQMAQFWPPIVNAGTYMGHQQQQPYQRQYPPGQMSDRGQQQPDPRMYPEEPWAPPQASPPPYSGGQQRIDPSDKMEMGRLGESGGFPVPVNPIMQGPWDTGMYSKTSKICLSVELTNLFSPMFLCHKTPRNPEFLKTAKMDIQ